MENDERIKELAERAKKLKVGFIDLSTFIVDPAPSRRLKHEFAKQNKVVPIQFRDDTIVVAMADPSNLFLQEQVEFNAGMKITPVLADEFEIVSLIEKLYSGLTLDDLQIPVKDDKDTLEMLTMIKPETTEWFNMVLVNALRRDCTDIHIETYEKEITVRYRIDGVISETAHVPRQMESQIFTYIKSLAKMKIEKRNIPQQGLFKIVMRGQDMTVRVYTLPCRVGERMILRIMDSTQIVKKMEELGMEPEDLQLLQHMINHRQGLLLLSGPSGSGISTTLYSVISSISKPQINIITVEDPIEAPLPGVNQVETNPKIDMGAAECLRAAMQHLPDVIMLRRIKDQETARLITEAAITGQLAIAGVYASDSINAITRLLDFGVPPYFISTSIIGAVSQRLARMNCSYCLESVEITPELKKELEDHDIPGPYNIQVGRGCSHCLQTGFKGRLAIYELLHVSDSLRAIILKGSTKVRLMEQAKRDGMKTLYVDGLKKIARGLTTYEEIQRVLTD